MYVFQLVEHLLAQHALASITPTGCDLSTQRVEAGMSQVQDHFWLQVKPKASLGYMRPILIIIIITPKTGYGIQTCL